MQVIYDQKMLFLLGVRTREVWAVSTFGEEGVGIREHD